MSYKKRAVCTKTDEKTFIKTFISEITAADERITCLNSMADIDEQFSHTASIPSFTLSIDGQCQITFTRLVELSFNSNTYNVSMPSYINTVNMNFSTGSYNYQAIDVRTFQFAVAANDNILCLYIGSYNNNPLEISVVCVDDGIKAYSGVYSINGSVRAINKKFTKSDSTSVFKADRLNYIYDQDNNTNVELIKSKVFLTDNTTLREASLNSIYDISTVPAEIVINIGGKSYFTLDSHTVMEV